MLLQNQVYVQVLIYTSYRDEIFFPHLVLWFNLVRKTEEQLVWCQFRRPLSLLFIPPHSPRCSPLVMSGFSFKPAIELSVRENFFWDMGLARFSFFPKLLYSWTPIPACLCWLSLARLCAVPCRSGLVALCCARDAFSSFWAGLRAQPAHTEALSHLLLAPRDGDAAAGGARWRFPRCSYRTARPALHTAEHIIKKLACSSSRSRAEQRRERWMSLWGSQPQPWAVSGASRSLPQPRGHPSSHTRLNDFLHRIRLLYINEDFLVVFLLFVSFKTTFSVLASCSKG